jgi:hypothetical protein
MNTTDIYISCTNPGFCFYRGDYPLEGALFLDGHNEGVEVEWTKGNDEWAAPTVLSQQQDLQKLIEDLFQSQTLAIEVSSQFDRLRRGRYQRVAEYVLSKRLVCRRDL